MPEHVGLRVSVQEEERRAVSAYFVANGDAVDVGEFGFEAGKEGHSQVEVG